MKLTIEISCNTGVQMENNLNKAIDDLSEALKKKGFIEMELIAYNETIYSEPLYKINIQTKDTRTGTETKPDSLPHTDRTSGVF